MSEVPREPADYRRIGRRELLRLWGPAALAGVAVAGFGKVLRGRPGRHRPPEAGVALRPRDWRVDAEEAGRIVVAGGQGPRENVSRALAAFGDIERFVGEGERVAIKPNCAWDRTPEQGANTDPDLIAEIARLCFSAGAASVVVLDNTCHDPVRSFNRSGIADAAKAVGATIAHQKSTDTVLLDLGGTALGEWQVLRPIAEADRVINVPIVKHHSLARVTLGMKNWFGAVVGRRPSLHQRLALVSAELGAAFRPTLTVVDATRVMTSGGPTGGSLQQVRTMDLVAVCTDPVAADAWGGSLLDAGVEQLPHLAIAQRLGLGTPDWRSVLTEA
jgi:uncharacterized protein (DUF362 family)